MNDNAKANIIGMATVISLALLYAAFHTDRPTYRVTVQPYPDPCRVIRQYDADTCYTYETTDTAGLHIYDQKFYIIMEEK